MVDFKTELLSILSSVRRKIDQGALLQRFVSMKIFFALLLLLSTENCRAGVQDHLKPCPNKTVVDSHVPGVDFVYVINLDRRPDRLASALEKLRPYGINTYRFSAVDAKTLSIDALEDVGVRFEEGMNEGQWVTHYSPDNRGSTTYDFLRKSCYGQSYFSQWMSKGAIGCALSHLSVLQDALISGYETIWVLEDDFVIHEDPRTISKYIDLLDSLVGHDNWDILYTDNGSIDPNKKNIEKKDFWFLWRPDVKHYDYDSYAQRTYICPDILKIGARNGAYSMIIRRSGMKKILDFETQRQLFLPYDNELILVPTLQQYNLAHTLVTFGDDFVTDIHTN
jgi:GR25 family glycosyltransferase involved in LPS biosynthesis